MNIEELKNKIELKEKELQDLKAELKKTHKLESVCIVNKETSIQKYEELKNKIKEVCKYMNFEDLGVKKLAYAIKGNEEAFYLRINWEGTGDAVLELEKYLRTNEDVLKFLTINRDGEEEE